jgi:hypothetical protein
MQRRFFILLLAALSLASVFASGAQAQRRDDDRFFFLRDPFGRGRSLFNFPERPSPPKPVYVEPPSDEPSGSVYTSSADADQQRFLGASEYVVVMGDTMAEQLSQGLADGFVTERPEVAIVKKTKASTGFVRADVYDWTAQASALLAKDRRPRSWCCSASMTARCCATAMARMNFAPSAGASFTASASRIS